MLTIAYVPGPAFVAAGEAMDEEGGGGRIDGLLCGE